MYFFDPLYFIIVGPAMLLAFWAQWKVKSAYAQASRVAARSRLTGHDAARQILDSEGLYDVQIEMVQGRLSDHYDPRAKMLRLSRDVYAGRSLAALGIAAHEAGHAIQDARRYAPLVVRNAAVPIAGFGSNLSFLLIIVGMLMGGAGTVFGAGLVWGGIALFSGVVFFQLVNLPVEFDASARAKKLLLEKGMVAPGEEQVHVIRVLNAAAMTYVAATLTAILTLLYFVFRATQSR